VINRSIPYGRQWVDDKDIAAVTDVLRSDWLTCGPTVLAFEEAIAAKVEAKHAVAFSSGTAALHGAAAAAGLGPGDLVVTSPLSFMASANCARFVGAEVGLVDIDPATLNLDLSRLPSTAEAVVPVHYAGLPVDLRSLANRPRVAIEDAAHALGATTPDGPVGNCALSDMCEFSLHPVKPITTGEGGLVTTNNDDLANALRRFRSHGMVAKPESGAWYYEISELAFNYRMTDIQAALGLSQLDKLGQFIARRNELAERYRSLLTDVAVILPPAAPVGFTHGYHLFPIRVQDRRRVFDGLRAAGIGVQVHYVPIHHHPISADIVLSDVGLPACDEAYEQLISLPMFPALTDSDQDYVVEVLSRLVG
jgi:perosamine synthetase